MQEQAFDPSGFQQRHAAAMLLAAGVGAAVGHPWPLAAVAGLSLLLLLRRARLSLGSGVFGWANAVTLLRVALTLAVVGAGHGTPALLLGAWLALAQALDVLDGWLARRTRSAGAFGAYFDMEGDALFVLLVGLELWLRGRLGPWILVPGALRYAYVLSVTALPPRSGEAPRSTFGRLAFVSLALGLLAPFFAQSSWADGLAAFGTLAVTASFAYAFWYAYGR